MRRVGRADGAFKVLSKLMISCFTTAQHTEHLGLTFSGRGYSAISERVGKICFTQKRRQMFSLHTAPDGFENETITCNFGCTFNEDSVREIT